MNDIKTARYIKAIKKGIRIEELKTSLNELIESIEKEFEGKIITDKSGIQWIMRDGLWYALCCCKPILNNHS